MRWDGSGTRTGGGRTLGRAVLGLLVALVSLVPHSSRAQTARLAVLADSVSAGEPFRVAVTVTHAPGVQVFFPEVPAGDPSARPPVAFGDAEALAVRRLPPALRGASRVDSAVVEAVTFAADSARVGPFVVQVVVAGDTATVRTGVAVVPVRTVLAGEAEPYEPAPIGPPETFASATPLWVALGLLLALLVGGLAWLLLRWRRRPRRATDLAPYPAALAALGDLDRQPPGADAPPEAVEAHVVATRDVLRGYLARRLRQPVREATTAEVEALLGRDERLSPGTVAAVGQALRPTDLVAFARVRPSPEVVARLRAQTRAAVEAVEADVRRAESPSPAG